jgi:hypothetical protein
MGPIGAAARGAATRDFEGAEPKLGAPPVQAALAVAVVVLALAGDFAEFFLGQFFFVFDQRH